MNPYRSTVMPPAPGPTSSEGQEVSATTARARAEAAVARLGRA